MANLFDLLRREKRESPENPKVNLSATGTWLTDLLGGGKASSGITVNRKVALSVPAFKGAVTVLASAFASLPLQVFDREGDGVKKAPATDGDVKILKVPSPEMTAFQLRKFQMQEKLIEGRSLTRILRNTGGRVAGLIPLETNKMEIGRSKGRLVYKYTPGEKQPIEIYKASEILDVPFALQSNGIGHEKPISELKDCLGLAKALEEFGARFFENDARPGTVFEMPGRMSEEAAKRAKADLTAKTKGLGKSHNAVILEGGVKVHTIGTQPDHAQFLESRGFQIREIATYYNIPPVFLQDLSRATFSNNEQQDLHWMKHTLRPWLEAWEQEINLKLFNGGEKRFVKFNIDGVIRGDFQTRMEGLVKSIQGALQTPNEARAHLELPPVDGGGELYIQQNMSEVDSLANTKDVIE